MTFSFSTSISVPEIKLAKQHHLQLKAVFMSLNVGDSNCSSSCLYHWILRFLFLHSSVATFVIVSIEKLQSASDPGQASHGSGGFTALKGTKKLENTKFIIFTFKFLMRTYAFSSL